MKNIVFISYTIARGGASKVMSLLMNEYASLGWNVTFVVRDVCLAYPLDERIHIIELGKEPGFNQFFYLKWLRKFIITNKPDVAVSFLVIPNVITLLATLGTKTKVVISERNDPRQYNKLYKTLIKLFYRFADVIVFQTERAKAWYPKYLQRKGVIIRNPISVNAYATNPCKKIVSAGRLEPQKNQKMLIEAFSAFHKIHPEYVLYIYGEGALRSELEDQIDSLGLSEAVFLPGNVSDIHERIKDADFFVLPSDFEGLSNMLLECMMMGLPCISTNCAGADEVIEQNKNGIIIPVGGKTELENAMNDLANNKNLRDGLAMCAKAGSSEFMVSNVMEKWKNLVERSLV